VGEPDSEAKSVFEVPETIRTPRQISTAKKKRMQALLEEIDSHW
jgi:hypothetical protein